MQITGPYQIPRERVTQGCKYQEEGSLGSHNVTDDHTPSSLRGTKNGAATVIGGCALERQEEREKKNRVTHISREMYDIKSQSFTGTCGIQDAVPGIATHGEINSPVIKDIFIHRHFPISRRAWT